MVGHRFVGRRGSRPPLVTARPALRLTPRLPVCARTLLLCGLTLLACGRTQIVVEMNLLSFVDDAQVPRVYHVPAGEVLSEPLTLEPQTVTLVEGTGGMIELQRVDLTLLMRFATDRGHGTSRVKLYLTSAATGAHYVYDTTPIHDGPVALAAGTASEVKIEVSSATVPTLIDAFESGAVTIGLALFIDALGSAEDLEGNWMIERFEALLDGTGALSP